MRSKAEIIIDIAHTNVDKPFSYWIPEELTVLPGHHVLVPFGIYNTPKEGFVLFVCPENEEDDNLKLKTVIRVIEPYPILTSEQIQLADWIRRSYHCLLVDALRHMIPSGLRGTKIHEKTVRTLSLSPDIDINKVLTEMQSHSGHYKAPKQVEVLKLFSSIGTEIPFADIVRFIPGSASSASALIKKGILCENRHVFFRSPISENTDNATVPSLNKEQQNAVDQVCISIDHSLNMIFLLHGVTGSGKTEVYLHCISECIRQHKTAIVLVPEISLTPQTVSRFRNRFSDTVAVLHSGLSAGERFDEWRRIRLGLAQIVIGARSAVFAPLENIGLIIIDEEHEASYQSESNPRYHASDIAAFRCRYNDCPLLLGSATPSLLSYFRVANGRYSLLELKERVLSRPLPRVDIVDMRDEYLNGNNDIFSEKMKKGLELCLSSGKQAMLLLNRRGYSTFVMCRSCGLVIQCPNCDLPMTYHKGENLLSCHFCGSCMPVPTNCPNCGKTHIKYFGLGTEQLEERVHSLFPDCTVLRMDADTMSTKNSFAQTLSSFASGKAQVLIGTQMIAKGHDFPNVTFVGVVAADLGLNIPDFRSAERTFQLLTQVAGRAGRAEDPGNVIIQTYNPDHSVIRFAKEHDYIGFYRNEIEARRKALFPPYTLFIRILISGTDESELNSFGKDLSTRLENHLKSNLGERYSKEILTFISSPAPIKKRMNLYRYQILLKILRTVDTGKIIRAVYEFENPEISGHFAVIEINPNDMF